MASPYLAEDESVVLATDNIIFRSEPISALILTNKRILFIRAKGDDLTAEEILLSRLRSAAIEKQAPGEPVFRLSFVNDRGTLENERVTFTVPDGSPRDTECAEWADKINEQIVPMVDEGKIIRIPPPVKEPAKEPAREPEPEPVPVAAVPPPPRKSVPEERPVKGITGVPSGRSTDLDILSKHERLAGFSFPEISPAAVEAELSSPAPERRIVMLAAFAIILLVVIAGAVLVSQYMKPGDQTLPAGTTAPVTARITTAVQQITPAPQVTSSPSLTPLPSPPSVTAAVPSTGVWIRVTYAGNYSGSIGEGSSLMPVSGAGEQYYQLAMRSGTIRAFVQKEDGSGNTITVDIFKNGRLIESGTTRIPYGEVIIQMALAAETPVTASTTVPAVKAAVTG